jgi:hypothetical protein
VDDLTDLKFMGRHRVRTGTAARSR